MEDFLKQIKFLDQKEKDLVNGYVHESQCLFPKDNHYCIIPSLVVYTILYYFYDPERFDQSGCGTGIVLSEDKKIATHTLERGKFKSVYGTKLIQRDADVVYEWKFLATSIPDGLYLAIGIHSFENHKKIIDEDFSTYSPHHGERSYFWAVAEDGLPFSNQGNSTANTCEWKEGDTIIMILDTEKKTLSYGTNDNEVVVLFDGNILYEETYMAITMGIEGLSIELISFLCKDTGV